MAAKTPISLLPLSYQKRQQKFLGYSIILTGIVIACLFIFPKVNKLIDTKNKIIETLNEKTLIEQKKVSKKKDLANVQMVFESQKIQLREVKEKFKNSSLKDYSDLRIAIQKIINNLGIIQLRTTPIETVEENSIYSKMQMGYEIIGSFSAISKLLGYLENSRWLISFRGSDLYMTAANDEKGNPKVRANFKVAGYILKDSNFINDTSDFTTTVSAITSSAIKK